MHTLHTCVLHTYIQPSFRWHLWRYWKCHACHANGAWGAASATSATQDPAAPNSTQFVAKLPLTSTQLKASSLPRKSSLRCWKWHACHAKSRGVKSAPFRRQASADIYGDTASATPATQSEPDVLKVSRLPPKKPRRQISPFSSPSFCWHLWWYRKCHACHAARVTPATQKAVASNQSLFVAKLLLTSMEILQVPRLPHKSSLRCWKCHACHAKSRGVKSIPFRRQASADIYGDIASATPATQIEPEVLKVSRLPRKKPRRQISPFSSPSFCWHLWRYCKCHACHTKRAWGAESVTPATQKGATSNQSPSFRWHLCRYCKCQACHTKRAWGAESDTPATQKAGASNQSLFAAKLPLTPMEHCKCQACHAKRADIYGDTASATPATQSEREVLKGSPLPRKKPRRQISPFSSSSFRWHLWRYCKCHACHTKRAWGAESVTPATQKAATSNQSLFVAKLPLTSMEILQVPRLPHKASLSCWKRHACHAKSRGVKSVPFRRQASADVYEDTASATPATQSEPEVLKVSRLPRKKPGRQISPFSWHLWSTARATPATQSEPIYGDTASATPATQSEREVLKVSPLPRKKPRHQISPFSSPSFRWHLWRYCKCHACHTKRAWGAESVTPATQKAAASNQSLFVAKLPLTPMEILQVPGLPRKKPRRQISPFLSPSFRWHLWRYCKCQACHAKSRGVKSVPFCRQASADI